MKHKTGIAGMFACLGVLTIASSGIVNAQSTGQKSNAAVQQRLNTSNNNGSYFPSFDYDPYAWLNYTTHGRVIPWNFNFTPNPSLKNYPGYSMLPPNVHLTDKYSVFGPLLSNPGRQTNFPPIISNSPNVVNQAGDDLIYGGSQDGIPPAITLPNGDILYGANRNSIRSNSVVNTGINRPDELFNFRHKTAGLPKDENGSIILSRSQGLPPYRVCPRDQYRHTFIYLGWGGSFFPGDWAYYPLYYPAFESGITVSSLYSNYAGNTPQWISVNGIYFMPPPIVYLPQPIYAQSGEYSGWTTDDADSYYLNQNRDENGKKIETGATIDRALENAMGDIKQAWENRNIALLSKHVKSADKIAVHLRGKYQYSLDSGDYIDMTKDAFRTTKTVSFDLGNPTRKEKGIALATGRHIYIDKNGNQRTVFLSYLFEKTENIYYITQVGTAPDRTGE